MYKLIIVDDDELIRKGLERVIGWEKLGFDVVETFSKASDALDYLKTGTADVLLTDIKMPEMSGLELIDAARQYKESLKSVIISGYGEFELAKQALLLRVEDYLLKPLGEKDIETAFTGLKQRLDEERSVKNDDKQKMKKEYELMRHLNHRIHLTELFRQKDSEKIYYEMVLIKLEDCSERVTTAEHMAAAAALTELLSDHFFVSLDGFFAGLVLPEQLNQLLHKCKRECSRYQAVRLQILIGREVYSEPEVMSSYWSVVEFGKDKKGSGVFHYEQERGSHKKEWDHVQELKNQMLRDFESGRFQDVDQLVQQINETLKQCDRKDMYYFYSGIVAKIVRYFELTHHDLTCHFAHRYEFETELQYPEAEQLQQEFIEDIAVIRKTLWENSDTMRSLIVTKAREMIESDYANADLSLAAVANQLNISYGYLSTIFTKTVGQSFKAYLVKVRMEHARFHLLSRKHRIYEIAELVGYKNPRYFTDAFKRYYQCSPMDYIARFRGEL